MTEEKIWAKLISLEKVEFYQNLPDIGDLWSNWQNKWEFELAIETSSL